MAVLGRDGKPLMPAHPARVKQLLDTGRAVVACGTPFVIRLKDRKANDSGTVVPGVVVGIDPGSRYAGMAVFVDYSDDSSGETVVRRKGVFAVQVNFRGYLIHSKLGSRAGRRRARRSRNTRYRSPRFLNRRRARGWLPPSLAHRINATMAMLAKLRTWFPVKKIYLEYNKFDARAILEPHVQGVEYQRGELFEYEVREFLLETRGRQCAYCDAADAFLTIDHIQPRARGGTNRVSNLTLACVACNQAKGAMAVDEFVSDASRLARILSSTRRSLSDAAAVNSTMKALIDALRATHLPVTTHSSARTKYNRARSGLPKSHCIDALSVGLVDSIMNYPAKIYLASATGRGQYQRTKPDRFGFPRKPYTAFPRTKRHFGFTTGDHVRAVVPAGKNAGVHVGRVAIRTSGSFNLRTGFRTLHGIRHTHFILLARNNGWEHGYLGEPPPPA
ncbi:RNA-guided endonuclease IscB [Cryobacterium sp. 10S3]|uniref:RNA-guided endonuclease IscB n=1 Tax=Cryobacterium sp. 10S3 TaxID=3048582 RepID=UPI002AC93FDB|nr:RNA-guided endonuclease IscB [Cryobacterium sp. 10S3]MEB0001661.1 RNA-guided endonuclease IscB [Cryobacterium sp. RTC2.1]MEB0286692.1 RNA-guided endonuclease IscB [Cryobacterium sp. 10S3]WPX13187.1 RNA-guided endonuclease IscB [Cryobacterium sp. 10S3]